MADDGYDPAAYMRGSGHTERNGQEADTDSAGRGSKQQGFSLRLHMPDGVHAPLLAIYAGAIWMDPDATIIEIPFSGFLRRDEGWQDGTWLAVIKGKRLTNVLDQIAEGRRLSVKVTEGDIPADKPEVSSIEILEMGGGI